MPKVPGPGHNKDEILNRLARRVNVAQFVSFGPDLIQRYSWIHGHKPNKRFASVDAAVDAVLAAAPAGSGDVRSFMPYDAKSREFIYGLRRAADVTANLHRLAGEGLHTI